MSGAVPQLRKYVKKNSGKAKFSKSLRLSIPDPKLAVIREEEPQNQEIACEFKNHKQNLGFLKV